MPGTRWQACNRCNFLRQLRGSYRVVVLVGDSATVDEALKEARVYRRRLEAANVAVVPVYTDGGSGGSSTAAPAWLWTGEPSRPNQRHAARMCPWQRKP